MLNLNSRIHAIWRGAESILLLDQFDGRRMSSVIGCEADGIATTANQQIQPNPPASTVLLGLLAASPCSPHLLSPKE